MNEPGGQKDRQHMSANLDGCDDIWYIDFSAVIRQKEPVIASFATQVDLFIAVVDHLHGHRFHLENICTV